MIGTDWPAKPGLSWTRNFEIPRDTASDRQTYPDFECFLISSGGCQLPIGKNTTGPLWELRKGHCCRDLVAIQLERTCFMPSTWGLGLLKDEQLIGHLTVHQMKLLDPKPIGLHMTSTDVIPLGFKIWNPIPYHILLSFVPATMSAIGYPPCCDEWDLAGSPVPWGLDLCIWWSFFSRSFWLLSWIGDVFLLPRTSNGESLEIWVLRWLGLQFYEGSAGRQALLWMKLIKSMYNMRTLSYVYTYIYNNNNNHNNTNHNNNKYNYHIYIYIFIYQAVTSAL